jgi:hypothetical protein
MVLLIMDVSVLNLFLITKKGIRKVNKGMHEERFETAENKACGRKKRVRTVCK